MAGSSLGASLMSEPLVTLAIPTYNRLPLLRQAVASALSQSYSNIQVIVSDNASIDGTADFLTSIRDPRLVFLRQPSNIGMSRNWDACLNHANGEFFILLSDDDYLETSAIEKLVNAFSTGARKDQIAFAYCRTWEVDGDGTRHRLDPVPPAYESGADFAVAYFSGRRKMHPCATLMRTADLKEVGGYTHESVTLAVDAIAWSRVLIKRGFAAGVREPLSNYRIHPGSETSSQRIDVWRGDIAALIALWSYTFANASPALQRRFKQAAAHYISWELAAIINQSARTGAARFRALGVYFHCRSEFMGPTGAVNLAGGLMKLFVPEFVKRPVRKMQRRIQQGTGG
jgi:glycosyltransferase involved in cell wall biosynthesis